ncbi:uncharacterized protein EI97DRAFT_437938 [Westerdykella ornata]|uniref:Uncharacterized protein n=1 Tax=Westerdykella ornata TaxID=318751 RepID=A0A6A6J817_WESOR|nr:uncharacterized protein EI97DRAFT_437938 [Westerdykella ornata]KAF2271349.1 hypothetical protein EI97DRAFT_437938 [Westerdykella ornata]
MSYTKLFGSRNLAIAAFASLGGSYLLLRSRLVPAKQKERPAGDFSVSVDRSGGGI